MTSSPSSARALVSLLLTCDDEFSVCMFSPSNVYYLFTALEISVRIYVVAGLAFWLDDIRVSS